MTDTDIQESSSRSLSFMLAVLGSCTGLFLSYGVLSGDVQGQVNLLFLIILFVLLPVMALILSLLLVLRPGGRGLVGWLLEIPMWSGRWRRALMQRDLYGDRKAWLVYLTQFFSLGFSIGCLLIYLLLLLATDISFVWRSTLLAADQLLPLLNALALPWWFWSEAQASMELLERTRDFRLLSSDQSAGVVGLWWRYILAAQVCYSILPRFCMLMLARHSFRNRRGSPVTRELHSVAARSAIKDPPLAEVVSEFPGQAQLLSWTRLPEAVVEGLMQRPEVTQTPLAVSAELTADSQPKLLSGGVAVVLVKGWEPPLGELADFLKALPEPGFLLPLDWKDTTLRPIGDTHLREWRRFAASLGNWQILQPGWTS